MTTVKAVEKQQGEEESRDRGFRTSLLLAIAGVGFLAIGCYSTWVLIFERISQLAVIVILCFIMGPICFYIAGKVMPRDPVYDLPEAEDTLFPQGSS